MPILKGEDRVYVDNFFKDGHPSLTLFYCGYDGEIRLSLKEEEEEDNE